MSSWKISQQELVKDKLHLQETLFHTANGYLGVRGNFEEDLIPGIPTTHGSYINGFYETYTIPYAEKCSGDSETAQTIIGVTDAQSIELWLDDEKFSVFDGTLLDFDRTLDMQSGIATRHVNWQSPKGKQIKLKIERIASFLQKELFILRYTVESVNFQGTIKIQSKVMNTLPEKKPHAEGEEKEDPRRGFASKMSLTTKNVSVQNDVGSIESHTNASDLGLICSVWHKVSKQAKPEILPKKQEILFNYELPIASGEQVYLDKYVVYSDSRRHGDYLQENKTIMSQVQSHDFPYYAEQQKKYLQDFWEVADIVITKDESTQVAIRFNIYQLLQAIGKDHYCSIAAKGLAGTGYEGHYFWDTEIYMLPFFLFTNPQLAKNLLLFRYNTLDLARERAKYIGHPKGAAFPWRTINGNECGPYYPTGTAAYHINPDIAYAVILYYQVTDDLDFIAKFGAEMIFETARVMYDAGHFRDDGEFCIDSVTGPDEYTILVNNNYYTNVMTKFQFSMCKTIWDLLKAKAPADFEKLIKKINLHEDEVKSFDKAAQHMRLPFDERLQIQAQDDSFLQKKTWDFENTPKEKYPLLLNFSPLKLNRYQVCKQADVTIAHMMREEETTLEVIKNSYHYYEPVTTHDSSLSHAIFSIMAARIGEQKKAWDYFQLTIRLDLDDIHDNTYYGLHLAAMGGTWMCIAYGFAGLRIIDGTLHLHPQLPDKWDSLQFTLLFKNRRLSVTLERTKTTVKLISGEPITIYIDDKACDIS